MPIDDRTERLLDLGDAALKAADAVLAQGVPDGDVLWLVICSRAIPCPVCGVQLAAYEEHRCRQSHQKTASESGTSTESV